MKNRIQTYLSDQEIDQIYATELRILESIGIKIDHENALELLAAAGAKVDRGSRTVLLPPALVEKCLAQAPRQVVFAGRAPEDDRKLAYDQTGPFTRTITGAEIYRNPQTGEAGKGGISDMIDWFRLVDGLDYDFCTSFYPDPEKVPLKIRDIQIVATAFMHTTKHLVIGPYDADSLKYMLDLALAIRGDRDAFRKRPLFSIMIASISPLQLPRNQVEMILMGSEYGVPLELMPMPMAGVSAPASIPGVVAMAGAEALAMNAIAQLAHPGTPVVYEPRTGHLDMSVGVMAIGLEWGIVSAIETQMARQKYRIPVDVFGPISSAVVNDAQAMIESSFTTLFPVLAGASIVGGAGCLGAGMIADPTHLVLADEILKMAKKALSGVAVDEESLGYSAIESAGIGGDFLSQAHTLKHFRDAFYRCPYFNLNPIEIWREKDGKDMNQKARQKAMTIMKEHRPPALKKATIAQIDAILKTAETELGRQRH